MLVEHVGGACWWGMLVEHICGVYIYTIDWVDGADKYVGNECYVTKSMRIKAMGKRKYQTVLCYAALFRVGTLHL